MTKINKIYTTDDYVYDISLDGTVVNALGENIISNTDGFNFVMPSEFRYTKENPYIGKGLNRDVVEGKEYVGLEADVMEFDDLFMRKKMGLGIDEIVPATVNYSRKNYSDLLDVQEGKVKLVGNTVKSRRMSTYIEKFLDKGILLLLYGKGKEFLDEYYNMVDDIDNYRISIRDIASKGKIKKKISEYKADCQTLTKSGSKKSRQAWYELLINEGIDDIELNSEIYYLNIGKKKGDSDVKRITHQFTKYLGDDEVEMTTKIKNQILKELCEKENIEYKSLKTKGKKELLDKYNIVSREEDEIKLACVRVPNEIVNAEKEFYCAEHLDYEYNVDKYVEQFNKRIEPLLVCFSPEIRSQILVKHKDDRPFFTDEQCVLDSGHPNNETDQDTYEQLMTIERKEIEYWDSVLKEDEEPPFCKECGQDWKKIREDFRKLKQKEEQAEYKVLDDKYKELLSKLKDDEYNKFIDEGEIPKQFMEFCYFDNGSMCLKFNGLDMTPSTGGYIFEDFIKKDDSEEKFEMLNESLSQV